MSVGPVMLDLAGPETDDEDREILRHPLVGGVVLFSRNYRDPDQLRALTAEIHALKNPPLLVAVDHEGGRVQRFHGRFTRLPACRVYGRCFDTDREAGLRLAHLGGWLMAAELLAAGVDFSFAPVLDLDRGISRVVGDRAFHSGPDEVTQLARRFARGMKEAGMAAVGKHFPGHGGVREDSHDELPVDGRSFEDIALSDLLPFERMIADGLPAIMPAHIVFAEVDRLPAGFSPTWLRGVLRGRLGFRGAVFSDDICMAGAEFAGGYAERAAAALSAGCDMVLVCNDRKAAIEVLEALRPERDPASQVRLMRMHGSPGFSDPQSLRAAEQWQGAARAIALADANPELELGDDEIHS
jgi:beta-N-acetylhexosaminidase